MGRGRVDEGIDPYRHEIGILPLTGTGKTVTKYRREEGIFPAVYHFPGESKHYFQILPDFFGKNVAFSDFGWYNDNGSLGAALCCPFSKK